MALTPEQQAAAKGVAEAFADSGQEMTPEQTAAAQNVGQQFSEYLPEDGGDTIIDPAGQDQESPYFPRTNDYSMQMEQLMNSAYDMETPDLEKIRSDLREGNQAIVDSISAQYANRIADEEKRGDVMNKRVRSSNVSSGLSGSDFASANAIGQEDLNMKAVQALEKERDSAIQATLANIENKAQEFYQAQRSEYRQSAEDKLKMMAAFKNDALADVQSFAGAGVSSAQLKEQSPSTWQALLDQTGYSDVALSAMFAASRPQSEKVYQETVGNKVVIGYRDPQTGKISQETIELPEGLNDFRVIDGKPYFVDLESQRIIPADGYKPSGPKAKTFTSGGLVTTESTLASAEQELNTSRGEDGWVDPNVYKQLHDDWVADKGLTKDFLNKFPPKTYVNPANTWLPPFLRNPTKTDSSSGGGSFDQLINALNQ